MNTHRKPGLCTCLRRTFLGALTFGVGASAVGARSVAAHDRLLPDTPAARAAEDYLALVSNVTMVRHCKRSFRFALALAEKARAKPDLEALYVGCLFHDLGLETLFAGPEDFETLGAREAKRFLISRGHDRLAEQVSAAIELHTSVESANDPRPEVAYLMMGAFSDVFGSRLDLLAPRIIQQVVAEYPRDGTKALLKALLKNQIDIKPQSRIGRAAARADVLNLIQNAPFGA